MRYGLTFELTLAFVFLFCGTARAERALHGLNFSPYLDGQSPGTQISADQIHARLITIAPYIDWVRTFGSANGLEQAPAIAHELGFKVAAQAWIGPNLVQNDLEIGNLIANIKAGHVNLAIIGSEVLLRKDVSEAQLLAYIQQVRQVTPPEIPVATAETFDVLLAHPSVIDASDVLLPNIYPYWQGISASNAICELDAAYNRLVLASGDKPIIIAETGWPSDGNAIGPAVPSLENASSYFLEFVSWAKARQLPYFYFAAYDETWKAATPEGPQGAHWGIWDTEAVLKPGMQPVLDEQTVAISCSTIPGGPGTPHLHFTHIPPYGSVGDDLLEGVALHVPRIDYNVIVYILVGGGWWVKPTFAAPLTPIQRHGNWSADIVTGGNDTNATQIAAFLIPNTYTPPLLANASALPASLYANSVAYTIVSRSSDSPTGPACEATLSPLSAWYGAGQIDDAARVTAMSGCSWGTSSGASWITVTSGGIGEGEVRVELAANVSPNARSGSLNIAGRIVTVRQLGRGTPFRESDLLWQHSLTGKLVAWFLNGTNIAGHAVIGSVSDPRWRVVGTGDFNTDRQLDIVWQHDNGTVVVWYMEGTAYVGSSVVGGVSDANWKVFGAGDFTGDGQPDLLWRHAINGDVVIWQMNGASYTAGFVVDTIRDSNWHIKGIADFDGDGDADILWQRPASGFVFVWIMAGPRYETAARLDSVSNTDWVIMGAADFNGDDRADVLWQNLATGMITTWLMNSTVFASSATIDSVSDLNWRIVAPR